MGEKVSMTPTSTRTLNLGTRKQEVLRIDRENKRLVEKMKMIKPIIQLAKKKDIITENNLLVRNSEWLSKGYSIMNKSQFQGVDNTVGSV